MIRILCRRPASRIVLGLAAILSGPVGTAVAEEPAGPSPACAGLDAAETAGRDEVGRRIAEIDRAAEIGDTTGFCLASAALVEAYASTARAASACSPDRAARWISAADQTRVNTDALCR